MVLQRHSRAEPSERATKYGVLAAVVSARRQDLGLSQVELGDLAGVSYRTVLNVENGRTEISLSRLISILETLGLHLVLDRGALPTAVASPAVLEQYRLNRGAQAGPSAPGTPGTPGTSGAGS